MPPVFVNGLREAAAEHLQSAEARAALAVLDVASDDEAISAALETLAFQLAAVPLAQAGLLLMALELRLKSSAPQAQETLLDVADSAIDQISEPEMRDNFRRHWALMDALWARRTGNVEAKQKLGEIVSKDVGYGRHIANTVLGLEALERGSAAEALAHCRASLDVEPDQMLYFRGLRSDLLDALGADGQVLRQVWADMAARLWPGTTKPRSD